MTFYSELDSHGKKLYDKFIEAQKELIDYPLTGLEKHKKIKEC